MVHGENQGTRLTDHYTCDGCCVVWQMFPLSREGERASSQQGLLAFSAAYFLPSLPFPSPSSVRQISLLE